MPKDQKYITLISGQFNLDGRYCYEMGIITE